VGGNNIFSLEVVEHVRHLTDFVDLNLKANPVCVHKELKDEILVAMPNLERFNGEQIHESGYKYRQATQELQKTIT
jgi:hypothetical protein